jgi:hypothetical protein
MHIQLSQFLGSFPKINYSKLRKSKVQPKCKIFMWLWLRQRILTDDMLQLRGIDHGDVVPCVSRNIRRLYI